MADMMILWDKATDTGTWSGGNWRTGLPLTNLAVDDIAVPARSVSADPADTWCRVDLGRVVLVGGFALLRHTISASGRVRFAVSEDVDGTAAGPFVADSGWMDGRPPDVPWGALPWGAQPWSGHSPSLLAQPGVSLWLSDAAVLGRIVWMWIDDPHNPDGWVQAGRLIAGPVFGPQQNMNYGVTLAPGTSVRSGGVKRTRSGRKLRVNAPTARALEFTLEHIGTVGLDALHDLAALGPDHTMVIAYDPDDSPALLARRAFCGSLSDPARIVTTGPDIHACTLKIEEDL